MECKTSFYSSLSSSIYSACLSCSVVKYFCCCMQCNKSYLWANIAESKNGMHAHSLCGSLYDTISVNDRTGRTHGSSGVRSHGDIVLPWRSSYKARWKPFSFGWLGEQSLDVCIKKRRKKALLYLATFVYTNKFSLPLTSMGMHSWLLLEALFFPLPPPPFLFFTDSSIRGGSGHSSAQQSVLRVVWLGSVTK